MRRPGPVRAFLIDIEGVLVRDKRYEPVAGAVDWLQGLAADSLPFRLVSNNTTDRPVELIARLAAAGFPVTPAHLVGALDAGRRWLLQRDRRRLLWLGHPRLADWWQEGGFTLAETGSCDAVVLGVNPELGPGDLERAMSAVLDDGVDTVCLHRNRFWLDDTGRRRLGPGAWAAALEALGGRGDFITIGKPAETIYHEALKSIGVSARESLFISDDPEADLVTAGRLGMRTAFVLSGKHGDHGVLSRLEQDDWPDLVCASLADVDTGGPASDDGTAPRD
jgi:4-nitrophenyl phosphatase